MRRNTSAVDNASWLVAVGILAVVIPASDKVSANQVFFAAHGVSSIAWVVLLVCGIIVAWLALLALLTLLQRLLSARSWDVVVTSIMLLVSWFLIGNILTRTVFAGLPWLGPVVGLVGALGLTLLARRVRMGTILAVFAALAATVPLLISSATAAEADQAAPIAFDPTAARPSILWVISDELQYPLVFTPDGRVRPEFPHLAALASQSTTYSRAYTAANYTDYAVPAMLSGISDISAVGAEGMQPIRAGIGVIPDLGTRYHVVMKSPIYSYDCNSASCASVGAEGDQGVVERYWSFTKDILAIAGRTTLAEPFASRFPSLDGKWRDFWSGGDEFGDNAEGDTVGAVIAGINEATATDPGQPWMALWHTIRTHAPWVVDREGRTIYPSRVPVVPGAHMIGAEADQTYTTDALKHLERRLYADSAIDFDRQLGLLIDDLKATGQYDDTMIIVTADHGATMTDRADRRVGDTLVQRWSEVAHVPLVVKDPGQTTPRIVDEPRSTGQIAATVLRAAGADPTGATSSPDLSMALPDGPVFTTVAGGVLTPWRYGGVAEVDPWLPDDLSPPDPDHPFAVGIDTSLLGQPVPDGWVPVEDVAIQVLPGESTQQVVIVDRSSTACPVEATSGLVTSGDRVVGSVLWEGPRGSSGGQTRGWAIVPRADDYRFWCPAG